MMIEREAGKFGGPLDSVLSVEQRRHFVRGLLREIARHMADDQTEAIDEVTIAWLVEIAAPEALDPESLALLKNRAAVVAFLENDDAPRYRRFAHAQLLNFFLAEVTIDTISSDEVPKFIRRNILGCGLSRCVERSGSRCSGVGHGRAFTSSSGPHPERREPI